MPEEEKQEHPPIDFNMFVLSLATSAHMQLGLIPNPLTKKVEKDVNGAKQTIDILGILEEKTKNNLTKEEEELIKNVVYDLRMRYVNATTGEVK